MSNPREYSVGDALRRFEGFRGAYARAQAIGLEVETAAAARGIYQAIADACKAYGHPQDHPPSGGPLEQMPAEMALMLGNLVGTQLAGKRTQSFEDLIPATGGAATLTPSERADLDKARRYILACKKGLIADRAPLVSIATWFGVKRHTVMSWNRPPMPETELKNFFPSANMESRGALIIKEAKQAGKRYSAWGHGQKAIKTRDAKSKDRRG